MAGTSRELDTANGQQAHLITGKLVAIFKTPARRD
jgi:hypothetical protein